MHIYFRADGNSAIATGHMMRCLSIADACKEKGHEVTFIVADAQCDALIFQRGYDYIDLCGKWDDLEYELEILVGIIKTNDVQILIIDSYYVTKRYLRVLKTLTKTVYIDDLNAFIYPVDMLINYSICADELEYPSKYSDTKLLLGCHYVPLRLQFSNVGKKVIRKQVKNILITTGGTDSQNMMEKLLGKIQLDTDFKHIDIHVVTGIFNSHLEELRALESRCDNVIVHCNVTDMAVLMIEADLAVSAGGSTLYELSACGVPTITYSFADNQLGNVRGFAQRNLMDYAGDTRNDLEVCVENIIRAIKYYMHSKKKRSEVSQKLQKLVDGRGRDRIVKTVDSLQNDVLLEKSLADTINGGL